MEQNKTTRRTTYYSKGKIYIIRCKCDDELIYIGLTCQALSQRMGQHRRDASNQKTKHTNFHETMQNIGVSNFYNELLENYGCERNEQLLTREGECVREYASGLNKNMAGQLLVRSE